MTDPGKDKFSILLKPRQFGSTSVVDLLKESQIQYNITVEKMRMSIVEVEKYFKEREQDLENIRKYLEND